jgi:hypothetical protein
LHFENAENSFSPTFALVWDFLAETNIAVRRAASVSEVNSLWVVLLDKVRTHFEPRLSVKPIPAPFPTVGKPSLIE